MDTFIVIAGSTGLLASLIALLSLFPLRTIAGRTGLVDLPDQRKKHNGAVPVIGGLSVFCGLFVAWFISMPFSQGYGIFLLCSLLMVTLGAVDDARHLPASFRLWAQITLGALLVYGSGIWIDNFGNLLGFGLIGLAWLGPVVTILAIITATNAFNMIDGIDGLAGSIALVGLVSLLILFLQAPGFGPEVTLTVALMLALLPFLMANLRIPPFRRRIFLGDAGSLFIGFSMVWLLTKGTQLEASAFRPVTALYIVAVPLMDMVAIMIRRARKGLSVMKADRDHLHHIFMRAGFTDRQALVLITTTAIVMAAFGLVGEWLVIPEWLMLAVFLALFALYHYLLAHSWRFLVALRRHYMRFQR